MFSQPITPAVKQHLEAQQSFFSEMSRKMFDSAQKMAELNLQLVQETIEEISNTSYQLIQAKDSGDFSSVAATQIQPTTEKLRNYQQRLTNLIAGTHSELTKTAESHMPEAARTATAVADEVARNVSEETDKATQRQRAVMEKMAGPARKAQDSEQSRAQQSQSAKH